MIFHAFGTPQKVGIQGLRQMAAGLVKVAFLMKIMVFFHGKVVKFEKYGFGASPED